MPEWPDPQVVGETTPVEESTRPTTPDLMFLMLGIASALLLPTRHAYWPPPRASLNLRHEWLIWGFVALQWLGMACVAAGVVGLGRCLLHRRTARPAEFLAMCAAAAFLEETWEVRLSRIIHGFQPGDESGYGFPDRIPFILVDHWEGNWLIRLRFGLFLVGLVAGLIWLAGRKRLPGWIATLLAVAAWEGMFDGGMRVWKFLVFSGLDRLLGGPIVGMPETLASFLLYSAPRALFFAIPAVVVWRSRWDVQAWLDWTCLGLVLTFFLASEGTEAILCHGGTDFWNLKPDDIDTIAAWMAYLVALAVARRFAGRPWPEGSSPSP